MLLVLGCSDTTLVKQDPPRFDTGTPVVDSVPIEAETGFTHDSEGGTTVETHDSPVDSSPPGDTVDSGPPPADPYLTFTATTAATVLDTETEHLTAEITVELWLRVRRGAMNPGQVIVGKHICGMFNGWWLGLSNNRPAFYEAGSWWTGPTALDDDAWHHVAGVFDGSMGRVYVDGVEVVAGALALSATNDVNWYLGDGCDGRFGPEADVDDVVLWSVARDAADIAADMGAPPLGTEPDLALYLPLDEGSGQTSADFSSAGRTAVLGTTDAVEARDAAWGAD